MKLSPLQVARYQYSPKLPGMLRNGFLIFVCAAAAPPRASRIRKDQGAVPPNTYGKNEITFQKG